MLCERCNQKKATVFYRENIGGRVRAWRLCGECAEALEKAGELEDMSTAISGFMSPFFQSDETFYVFPMISNKRESAPSGGRKCDVCGITFAEITASGKLGCAACYKAFPDELSYLLRSMHGVTEHRGRVSAGYRIRQEKARRLVGLKKQLREAVAAERFEAAAELRDTIRALEAEL